MDNNKLYKRSTVKIPKITESHSSIRLRKENYRIIRSLERMENGPFGIKKLLREWLKSN